MSSAQLTRLFYELLDAHDDTARLAADLAVDSRWQVHLEYLRGLQCHGRESPARAITGPQRLTYEPLARLHFAPVPIGVANRGQMVNARRRVWPALSFPSQTAGRRTADNDAEPSASSLTATAGVSN